MDPRARWWCGWLIFVGVLAGCRGMETVRARPPEGNRMQTDHAPTPFSAEEIRAGCPEGRWDRYALRRAEGPPVQRTTRFVRCTESDAELASTVRLPDGTTREEGPSRATWTELQRHASFPQSRTTIANATCATSAGEFDCWLYVVGSEGDGGMLEVRKFWFAKDRPGPPVMMEYRRGEALQLQMILLAGGQGEPPAG